MPTIYFEQFVKEYQTRINTLLETYLANLDHDSPQLKEAMKYAVLNGGKRIRPLLVYATTLTFTNEFHIADNAAMAIECIHCYSLIHDDLPAMDNDDLRRGKPTCHKMFGDATAILAGDALQALSFELLSVQENHCQESVTLNMVQTLAKAIGLKGMAAGQMQDILSVGQALKQHELETMHQKKTGALITASILLGAYASCQYQSDDLIHLKTFGDAIGLAFQIYDDILDVDTPTEILGKPQGSDSHQGKPTYPSTIGVDASKEKIQMLYDQALSALKKIKHETMLLEQLAGYMIAREY